MSLMLMYRLRHRFHGLYTDYGCKLWLLVIIQIVSLFIGTAIFGLGYCDAWLNFWVANELRVNIYNSIIAICTQYVPMLTQLSSLAFSYIRH